MSGSESVGRRDQSSPDNAQSGATTSGSPEAQRPAADAADVASRPPAGSAVRAAGDVGAPAGGVKALRAILMGNSPRTSDEARLTAIERRLDTLSLQLARAPQGGDTPAATGSGLSLGQEARLAGIEQRLNALAAQMEVNSLSGRGGEASSGAVAALGQQVDGLRQDHARLAEQTSAQLAEADMRCRMRQLRVRTARRQELLLLRRRLYAPAGAFTSASRATRSGANAAVLEDGNAEANRHLVDDTSVSAAPVSTPIWPNAPHGQQPAVVAQRETEHTTIRRESDIAGARHVLGRSLTGLFHSIATVIVVVWRLAAEDLRATGEWVGELIHPRDSNADEQRREDRGR